MRLDRLSASTWSWVTKRTATLSRFWSSFNSRPTSSRSLASRLLNGSSRSNTRRLAHQRPRKRHSLLLPAARGEARVGPRIPPCPRVPVRAARALSLPAAEHSARLEWKRDVLFHRHVWPDRRRTETPCRPCSLSGGTKSRRDYHDHSGWSPKKMSPPDRGPQGQPPCASAAARLARSGPAR